MSQKRIQNRDTSEIRTQISDVRNTQHSSDMVERQIGFELLSIFKGASAESIDDAVERVLALQTANHSELLAALQYAQHECRVYLDRHPQGDSPYPTEAQYLADRVGANCERVLAKIGGDA